MPPTRSSPTSTEGKVVRASDVSLYDPNNAANIASVTVIAPHEAGGRHDGPDQHDPLILKQITQEATKQNYFPEWVIGPSVLADTTIFGRTYDQQQWKHAPDLGVGVRAPKRTLVDSTRRTSGTTAGTCR